jgi:hypothetical protein
MIFKIFFSICFTVLILSVQPGKGQVGIKGGIGVSDIVFAEEGQTPYLGYEINYMEHRTPLLTFQIGAFGTIKLSEKFYFQPELLYIKQGLDYDIRFLYDDITYQIRINYLQAPFLFSYKGAPGKKSRPGFFIGPYYSLKINAVRDVVIEGTHDKSSASQVRNSDYGIVAGFSVDLNLPNDQLIFEFKTSYGLSNMMDRVEGYIPWYYGPDQERAKNISITLMIGYRFVDLLGKKSQK